MFQAILQNQMLEHYGNIASEIIQSYNQKYEVNQTAQTTMNEYTNFMYNTDMAKKNGLAGPIFNTD